MLTETDLAIVRAALMFLDEEFFPDQEEMFQHYLDDEGVLAGAGTDQIKATRAKFEAADLYVAVKQLDGAELTSNRLLQLPLDEELTYQIDREQMVAVIVPR